MFVANHLYIIEASLAAFDSLH